MNQIASQAAARHRFRAFEHIVELITWLRPVVDGIAKHDRSLADQIRRACSAAGALCREGSYARGGNRVAKLHQAMSEADEVRAHLRIAEAWGYVRVEVPVWDRLDHIVAVLWKLTH